MRARRGGVRTEVLAAVALLTAAVAACGVQADRNPQNLSAEDVPYALLEAATSTSTSTTVPGAPKAAVSIFLVAGDRLHPVARQVTEPPTVAKALSVLLAGPEEDEVVAGLRSAINPAASLVPSRLDPATLSVDLSTEFVQGPTSEQVLGLAQIVFTVTEITGVTGVRFSLEGAPIQVPTPSGTTSSPLGREAFSDLAPVPPDPAAPS